MSNITYQLTKSEFIVRLVVGVLISPIVSLLILFIVVPIMSYLFTLFYIYNPTLIFFVSFLLVFIPVLGYWVGRFCMQKIILQTDSLVFKWYFGFKSIKWNSIESFSSYTFD